MLATTYDGLCGGSGYVARRAQRQELRLLSRRPRLAIPKNVFVIGTVNVDETTYMFSPKVLDRAFVLEFNDVDLAGLAGPVQCLRQWVREFSEASCRDVDDERDSLIVVTGSR
jgi:hypothetical protein